MLTAPPAVVRSMAKTRTIPLPLTAAFCAGAVDREGIGDERQRRGKRDRFRSGEKCRVECDHIRDAVVRIRGINRSPQRAVPNSSSVVTTYVVASADSEGAKRRHGGDGIRRRRIGVDHLAGIDADGVHAVIRTVELADDACIGARIE